MNPTDGQVFIQSFIRLFSDQKWDEAKELLHPDFLADWPQYRERMNRDGYIEVNRHYPGKHQLTLIRSHEVGALVIATIWIEADTGQKTFVNSFFEIQEGRIAKVEEYWAEPGPAPEWRKQWVEAY